jgi:hypothetical protein
MPDRPPALTSDPERDEAAGYRPVSGLAVAALLLAGVSAVAVVVIGLLIWRGGRPILSPGVLVLGAFGLALSIAARWHVRRAEGTRTGLGLSRAAFWLSILSLGSYGAYYAAIDFAVRQQARAAADKFFACLLEGKPELAFRLTRDPAQQRGIPDDPKDPKTIAAIRARFGATDLHQFLQTEVVQLFRTWPEKIHVTFAGPGRVDLSSGFVIELNYTIRTPEGQFDVDVFTRGVDDSTTGGRDWHVLVPMTSVRKERRLTHLGRLCGELQLVWGRSRYPEWSQRLPATPINDVATILRIDDHVPPEEQRRKLAEEVKQPGAINQFPGAGPTRPPALPALHFDADGIRISNLVQIHAPTLAAQCPAVVTAQLTGEPLVKTLLSLAGPDWENQPLLPVEDYPAQLVDYKYEFKVISLDFRPSLPPIAPAPQGS